ncbi:MAG: hypothetical protein VB042_09480, partial [Victivallaceae bacterium]|nr:hypothetical protein [Victivallaceae bacterium]
IAAADPVDVLRELVAACAERGRVISLASGFLRWNQIRTLVADLDEWIKWLLPRFLNPSRLSNPDASTWSWTLADFYAAAGITPCETEGSFQPLLRVEWVWEMQRMLNAMYLFMPSDARRSPDYTSMDYHIYAQGATEAVVQQAIRTGDLVYGSLMFTSSELSYYQSGGTIFGRHQHPCVQWLTTAYTVRVEWRGWLDFGVDFSGNGLTADTVSVVKDYPAAAVGVDLPPFDRAGIVFPPLSGPSLSNLHLYPVCYANEAGGYDKYVEE